MPPPETETVTAARLVAAEAESVLNRAGAQLAGLLAARRPLVVLAPADGEAASELRANRAGVIDAELAVADAQARLDHARAVLADAERAATADEAERLYNEARTLGDEMVREAETFDSAIKAAVAALERREKTRARIIATGCVQDLATGIAGRGRIRRAIAHAGLFAFVDEHIPHAHRVALANADRAALRLVRRPVFKEAVA